MRDRRVVVVVLDGVGIGALPDAALYGDAEADTLGHLAARHVLHLPHLAALGLGNIEPLAALTPAAKPEAAFGKMSELSVGKDTTIGHWELMGVVSLEPFPTYPEGLPRDLLRRLGERLGREVLGGEPASGTEILARLGPEHLATGRPIVYTSADSVLQMAAHEAVVAPELLYEWCQVARGLLVKPHNVARVIARPFTGEAPSFVRTAGRRDFSLPPPSPTQLDLALAAGLEVHGIGKVDDVFAKRGFTACEHTADDADGITRLLGLLRQRFSGVLLANLNDTDTRYGHRNDPEGFARALEGFDAAVPELLSALLPGDLLIITADHGCDPTTPGTDHTREYVPVLVTGPAAGPPGDLGVRRTFADVAATLAEHLGVRQVGPGRPLAWPPA